MLPPLNLLNKNVGMAICQKAPKLGVTILV